MRRLRINLTGIVQGVGMRPFAARTASALGLSGSIYNSGSSAMIEIEGSDDNLDSFIDLLRSNPPASALIDDMEITEIEMQYDNSFRIIDSSENGKRVGAPPDIAVCPACVAELNDPENRRYQYPFISCPDCGPRWSIITDLPFDRKNTSYRDLEMCPECLREYNDPADRRYHSQLNSCPDCGPKLELFDNNGNALNTPEIIDTVVQALRTGQIVAVKGMGGYQLWADAANHEAVQKLRDRKHRPTKPFAMMALTAEDVRRYADQILYPFGASPLQKEIGHPSLPLTSKSAPIVLLDKKADNNLPDNIAPYNSRFGFMLPSTPLQVLLLQKFKGVVVATSGNISGEPICINEKEAVKKLSGIADVFLTHNLSIIRPLDDSVVIIRQNAAHTVRIGRGIAPLKLPITTPAPLPERNVLAFGADMKSTIAFASDNWYYVSQHLGRDGDIPVQAIDDMRILTGSEPDMVAADSHPGYHSARNAEIFADENNLGLIYVLHHHAHALSILAERDMGFPYIAVTWDGLGMGEKERGWGGEIFVVGSCGDIIRTGSIRPIYLIGGDAASLEPGRVAFSLVREATPPLHPSFIRPEEIRLFGQMLDKKINTPAASSIGRLFDGVAAILGLCGYNSYEGEAAGMLEYTASLSTDENIPDYPVVLYTDDGVTRIDWIPLIREVISELNAGKDIPALARGFHRWLAVSAYEIISDSPQLSGMKNIAISGGCFQNQILLDEFERIFQKNGYNICIPQKIPVHDGGIATGQVIRCV